MTKRAFLVPVATASVLVLGGCSPVYYKALEAVGIEKRELLVSRVESARDAQREAQQQFTSALEGFKSLVGYDGGELESTYESLKHEYERSDQRAGEVRERIAAFKEVAEDLFREWEGELEQYSDQKLRRRSEQQLAEARRRYGQLVAVMDRAAARMTPVLVALNDQVLFLKHNLNARALGSLVGTAQELERDVAALIRDMEKAVKEADRFIREMGGE